MTKAGLKAIAHAFNAKTDMTEKLIISADILKSLKTNKEAWKYFQKMPIAYKRIRISAIEKYRQSDAKKYEKSLAYFIKMTAQNKRIGFAKERRGLNK